MFKIFMFSVLIFLFTMCQSKQKDHSGSMASSFAYNLKSPQRTLTLPDELSEISDLALTSAGHLLCVQDEKGIIYNLDITTGEILAQYPFYGQGDFEGLTIDGSTAYAVTAKGVIFEIKNYNSPRREVKPFATFLNADNNVEGLCHDSANRRLLLACKGKPGNGLETKGYKAVYAFDLVLHELIERPAFTISLEEIRNKLKHTKGEKTKFSPSALAIHPHTGNIFLTASIGNLLVELDATGKLLHTEHLSPKLFAQPEGIIFDVQGGMYISNEGAGGQATILYFEMTH